MVAAAVVKQFDSGRIKVHLADLDPATFVHFVVAL